MSTITTTSTTRHLVTTGTANDLRLDERVLDDPPAGTVRIGVEAAPVNPVDLLVRAGVFHAAGRIPPGPVGLGWDLAGTIEAVGDDVRGLAVGDRVLALRDDVAAPIGAHGQAIVLPQAAVAVVPDALGVEDAATLPLNALTAWQALDLLDLTPGARLLVTGAAGAVGGFAVELGRRRDLQVVAVARATDAEVLRRWGAHEVVGGDALAGLEVDGALDAAMLGAGALAAVRDGGAFVAVSDPAEPQAERGVRVTTVHAHADPDQLAEVARLAAAGALTPRVAASFALDRAEEAYERVGAGGLRGRVVLVP